MVEKLVIVQLLMVQLLIVKIGYPIVVGVRVKEHVSLKELAVIMEAK